MRWSGLGSGTCPGVPPPCVDPPHPQLSPFPGTWEVPTRTWHLEQPSISWWDGSPPCAVSLSPSCSQGPWLESCFYCPRACLVPPPWSWCPGPFPLSPAAPCVLVPVLLLIPHPTLLWSPCLHPTLLCFSVSLSPPCFCFLHFLVAHIVPITHSAPSASIIFLLPVPIPHPSVLSPSWSHCPHPVPVVHPVSTVPITVLLPVSLTSSCLQCLCPRPTFDFLICPSVPILLPMSLLSTLFLMSPSCS